MSRRPTLEDVAQLADVSAKTVSRVVNADGSVSAQTRERVMEAVSRLGFQLNMSARSLASDRAYRVGVLSAFTASYFVTQLHQGAEDACRSRGYQLSIHQIESSPSGLQNFERTLSAQPLDGALITAPLCDNLDLLDLLDRYRVRYVRHSPLLTPDRSDAVFGDEGAGMTLMIGHLWGLGHRSFGIVRGPTGHLASQLRCDGALDALAALGIPAGAVHVIEMENGPSLFGEGMRAAEQMFSCAQRPKAICAFNDEVAAGILAFGHRHGLHLPHDLAVVGFGNADFCVFTWPQLTTLDQPNFEMGRTAVDWLTSPPVLNFRAERFPVQLIARQSAGEKQNDKLDMGLSYDGI